MELLNKLTVKQRLWFNLLLVTMILVFIAMTSRNALQEVNNSGQQLKTIQETQSAHISEFQTQFSNTLLTMNQYALTLDKKHGDNFNAQIERLKQLNLSLDSHTTNVHSIIATDHEQVIASPSNTNTATIAEDNSSIKASELPLTQPLELDQDTANMADILMNIKKSANSLVFLKKQIQETIVYGIDPSATALLESIDSIKQIENFDNDALNLVFDIENRLKLSQSNMARMTSSQDISYKTVFDDQGLGDSAESLFENLADAFEGDFTNQETFQKLVTAREGYQESFNDIADYIKTTKQNNVTISELSVAATQIVQQRVEQTSAQTSQLVEELNTLSSEIMLEVSIETIIALVVLALINILIVSSITAPLSDMRKGIMEIAQNGKFSQWKQVPGNNELSDIGDSIRSLLQSVQSVVSEINQVSQSLVEGNLKAKVKGHYQGDLQDLSQNFNNTMLQIRETLKAIDKTSVALADGNLNSSIELDKFKGDYHKVMSHLQSAIDVQKTSVGSIIHVMESMNQGDFSQRIDADLPGEYLRLKTNLNDSLNQLELAINTSNEILSNYQKGNFAHQSNIQFSGRLNDLKTNMDALASNISLMMSKVKLASHDGFNGVSEISTGNQDLSQRVQIQASSVQNTTASMEVMTSTVSESLQQAEGVNALSNSVRQQIQQGSEVVNQMDNAMNEISQASEEIANITEIIDGIAFQTNLLALNAAVEAARAGEAGRGFAVVAGEVRNLAGRSAEAAKQIREVSESSLVKVKTGLDLSKKTTETFRHNRSAVEEVSSKVSEMHNNLQQQVQGIQEINHAFNQIDSTTQQNASLVEEIASTSITIIAQMKDLEQSVGRFKLLPVPINKQIA